jgi:hypothetical protein
MTPKLSLAVGFPINSSSRNKVRKTQIQAFFWTIAPSKSSNDYGKMGRKPWTQRWTVEDSFCIDMAMLKGVIRVPGDWRVYHCRRPNSAGTDEFEYKIEIDADDRSSLIVRYTVTNNGIRSRFPLEYSVQTSTTPCGYGGLRYWLICPLFRNGSSCSKRVRKLYLPPGARFFGCRGCYRLAFESSRTHSSRLDRLLRLPIDEFRQVLYDDARKFGSLAYRIGRILRRRFAKKARSRHKRSGATAPWSPSEGFGSPS